MCLFQNRWELCCGRTTQDVFRRQDYQKYISDQVQSDFNIALLNDIFQVST